MSYRDLLRSGSIGLEINDVLRSSPRVLLGVESFAAETLASLGVETVFDLALSSTFAGAETVLRAAEDPATPSARVGRLPSDLFAAPAGTALVDVPGLDVEALRALPGALAGNVREAFDVTSIRDLALWPPYAAARRILAEASGSTGAVDDVTPGDLLPIAAVTPRNARTTRSSWSPTSTTRDRPRSRRWRTPVRSIRPPRWPEPASVVRCGERG